MTHCVKCISPRVPRKIKLASLSVLKNEIKARYDAACVVVVVGNVVGVVDDVSNGVWLVASLFGGAIVSDVVVLIKMLL